MPAGNYDFYIEKGTTFKPTIIYRDSDGVKVNLTGYTGRMQIRKNANAPVALADLTTENGGLTLTSQGEVLPLLSDLGTSALPGVSGVYDIELVEPSGAVIRLLQGVIEFSKEVTK